MITVAFSPCCLLAGGSSLTLPALAHQNRPDPNSCSEQQPKARSQAQSRRNRAFDAKLAAEAATHRHQHLRSKRAIDEVRGRLVDARVAALLRESSRDAAELAGCSHHTVRRYLAGREQRQPVQGVIDLFWAAGRLEAASNSTESRPATSAI